MQIYISRKLSLTGVVDGVRQAVALTLTLRAAVSPETGMTVNLKEIDLWLRSLSAPEPIFPSQWLEHLFAQAEKRFSSLGAEVYSLELGFAGEALTRFATEEIWSRSGDCVVTRDGRSSLVRWRALSSSRLGRDLPVTSWIEEVLNGQSPSFLRALELQYPGQDLRLFDFKCQG
ncbi:MAG: hypothetical protein N2578_07120 [Bdellovibrionaceae bacterium]|nr:hypothetical protein [Pseudobdellovibrionaceae bacterium]